MKAHFPQIRTSNQQAALDREIKRQLAVHMCEHEADYIAAMLWAAHTEFDFGHERLARLHKALLDTFRTLEQHYEMPDGGMYLARRKLDEYGYKIDETNDIFSFNERKL